MWVTGGCRMRQQLWRQWKRGGRVMNRDDGVPTRGWRRVFFHMRDASDDSLATQAFKVLSETVMEPSARPHSFLFFVFLFKFLCLRPPLPPTTSFGSVYMKLYETEDIKAGVTTKNKKKVKITHKEVSGGKLLPDLARVLIRTQTQITGRLWTHRWALSLSIVSISVASTPASSAAIRQIPNKDGANFDNSWTEGFPPNFCLECIKRPF